METEHKTKFQGACQSCITHSASAISSLLDLLLPRRCVVCQRILSREEKCLCTSCTMTIPHVAFPSFTDNEIVRRFWHVAPVHSGACLMQYIPNTDHHLIFEAMKYKGRYDICEHMGRALAQDLQTQDFFAGIDVIVPIPLSKQRKRMRGYNQSERIALGISKVTGIPIDTSTLARCIDNPSQTRISSSERHDNVKNIFAVKDSTSLQGRHILIVDDIITTGSTISSAIETLLNHISDLTFSVASIGVTHNN